MQQIGRMHVLQAFQALVNYILLVNILENICSNYSMQISVHEVEDEVDISIVFCSDDVLQPDDVFVAVQLLKEDDLSECPLGVSCILKSIEVLLERHNLLGPLVDGLPDDTVRTFAKLLKDLVLLEDVSLDLFRHISISYYNTLNKI